MKLDKWNELQSELVKLKKETYNPFYKAKYVEISDVLSYIKPLLTKYGFSLFQVPKCENGKRLLVTTIMGEDFILEGEMELLIPADDMQKYGIALTYARRYSLMSMFNLETEDDDGNGALPDDEQKKISTKGKSFDELETLEDFVNAIIGSTKEAQISALWYKWKVKFDKDSKEYKDLSKLSNNVKLQLGNPALKVKIFDGVENLEKLIRKD